MMRRAVVLAIVVGSVFVAGAPASAEVTDPAGASTGGESLGVPVTTPVAEPEADTDLAVPGEYSGDPVAEAALVATEDRRLIDVDLVSKGVLVPELDVTRPFRVTGTAVSTLVLPARESAYTLDELNTLAPQSVVKSGDGTYDLNESLAVLKGATLDIHARGSLTLRLASQPEGFVTIVSMGGTLVIRGDAGAPASITSWNALDGTPDTTTADGRAYIRAMGGQVSMQDVAVSDLGFWSGNTGGIALTGLVQTFGLGLGAGSADTGTLGGQTDGLGETEPGAGAVKPDGKDGIVTTTDEGIVEDLVGNSLVPEGVTAWLSNVTVRGNAFGIFAANASSIQLLDSSVSGSLIDGVVFHRQVERSTVERTASNDNVGDGFRVSRGSDAIVLREITATGNGRNGVTINAGPLATGPSAVGLPTTVYGKHVVRDAVLLGNARAGLAVLGGDDILLTGLRVENSPFGVIAAEGTVNLRLENSIFTDIEKQSIALRDGVVGEVTGTTMRGGETGVYSRDSVAQINHNTITDVTSHGITIVGEGEGTVIAANVVSGRGSSAIDVARAENVKVERSNVTDEWVYQSLTAVVVDNVKRPLTLMWVSLAAVLVFTAFSGLRQRRRGFTSPYHDRTPLSQYTRGLVNPATIPGAKIPEPRRARTDHPPAELPRRTPSRDEEKVGV